MGAIVYITAKKIELPTEEDLTRSDFFIKKQDSDTEYFKMICMDSDRDRIINYTRNNVSNLFLLKALINPTDSSTPYEILEIEKI